jgi:hypothetical protein
MKYTDKIIIKDYIHRLPDDIQKIVKPLRSMAKKAMPGAIEMVYHNALGYALSDSPFDRVCYIAPQSKGYVNFGFFYGADIADPTGLIQGQGKRLRHVKVYTIAEAKNPALMKLVEVAWEKAEADVTHWRNSLKKAKSKSV